MIRVSFSGIKCWFTIAALLLSFGYGLHASDGPKATSTKSGEPTDPKAHKTYEDAIEWQKKGNKDEALSEFRRANKQDGGAPMSLRPGWAPTRTPRMSRGIG
jgi:outer membrane protein assembly factor BamD (BamD/ComL family)